MNFEMHDDETPQDANPAPKWASYIAVGDSVTEGLTDPYPGQGEDEENFDVNNPDLKFRGWADRLAETLTARRIHNGLEPLQYANLAIRGRQLGSIIDEQLPAALEQKPDLISLVGGGNDILRPKADIDAIVQKLEDAVITARDASVDVLLSTGFRAGGRLAWTRGRTGQLNSSIWTIARRHGAYVMDVWGIKSLFDWRMFADDLIHPNSLGHGRIVNAALIGLGQPPLAEDWDTMLPPEAPLPIDEDSRIPARLQPKVATLKENAHWAKDFAGPWVERRVRGRSSGDGREPKFPTLTPWQATQF